MPAQGERVALVIRCADEPPPAISERQEALSRVVDAHGPLTAIAYGAAVRQVADVGAALLHEIAVVGCRRVPPTRAAGEEPGPVPRSIRAPRACRRARAAGGCRSRCASPVRARRADVGRSPVRLARAACPQHHRAPAARCPTGTRRPPRPDTPHAAPPPANRFGKRPPVRVQHPARTRPTSSPPCVWKQRPGHAHAARRGRAAPAPPSPNVPAELVRARPTATRSRSARPPPPAARASWPVPRACRPP